MLLVESLLADWGPGAPVPVLLPLSSWDPESENLRHWVARKIAEDYPGVLTEQVSAHELVEDNHVLPVFDGLDEVAAKKRSLALRKIGTSYDSRDPMVLTCRDAEFEAALMVGGGLTAASVVSMLDIPLADVTDYLCPLDGDTPWRRVLPELARRPGMARAAGSPLLVGLLRGHYDVPGRHPGELLNTSTFPDSTAVERLVLDDVVPTAFARRPVGDRGSERRRRWPEPLAQRWLRYLAARAHGGGLAWWRLAEPALHGLPQRVVALAAVAGGIWFAAALAMARFALREAQVAPDFGQALGLLLLLAVLACGVAMAFCITLTSETAATSRIWRRIEAVPGTARRARRLGALLGVYLVLGLSCGGAATVVPWVVVGTLNAVSISAEECAAQAESRGADTCLSPFAIPAPAPGSVAIPGSFPEFRPENASGVEADWQAFVRHGPALVTAGLAIASVTFLYGLVSPPARDTSPTPRSSLAAARRRALGAALLQTVGFVIVGTFPTLLFHPPTAVVGFGALLALTLVLWQLSRSAWAQYRVAHALLALHGHVPWRLMAFCDDAHRRNVLRQAGSAYEFRHETLRRHLAADP
ncbi:hypothetical protein [Streptomyces millisiae]|uniref:Uncharacterized protein n=1 Tax=Streptomyces millisiae TaxID=3075542 RepID=A0ABU2LRS6_9ACTN|nr:hypothetical protein [Streptomyces sp. DSM 44918]MDT0320288.1 hypothetical protein [Streptomyces sp. DSM 44918]